MKVEPIIIETGSGQAVFPGKLPPWKIEIAEDLHYLNGAVSDEELVKRSCGALEKAILACSEIGINDVMAKELKEVAEDITAAVVKQLLKRRQI
jgi:predicted transcriptional regulator